MDSGSSRIDTGFVGLIQVSLTPEALDSLSKQELIALILAQQEQIRQLMARVAELEAKLNLPPKTPSNSSLPPSKGQKANQPEKAKKLRKGRPGVARKLAENPDCIRDEFAAVCLECGKAASLSDQLEVYAYDHIDLPEIKPVVTRVNIHSGGARRHCGKRIAGTPPAGMLPGSPFGPGIAALAIYLHTRHMVSYNRLVEMFKGLFGLERESAKAPSPIYSAARTHRSPRKRDASMPRCVRQP